MQRNMYINDEDAVRSNIEFERNIRFSDVFKGGKINIEYY